jgi:hypothetical protein
MNLEFRVGTAGGTLFGFISSISLAHIWMVALSAAIGAIVSFLVTKFCIWAWKKMFS